MPDSNEVDTALIGVLTADSDLRTLLPHGWTFDIGMKGATAFGVVSLAEHEDTYMFQDSAWERFVFLVKAVKKGTGYTEVRAAAKRIHELLQDATLTITGYETMALRRVERVRFTEVDEDTDERWQHGGGQYELFVSPV